MDAVNALEELAALGDEVHWFCPRNGEDLSYFYDEDRFGYDDHESEEEKAKRVAKIKEATARKDTAIQAKRLFAYDGDDAVPYQNKLKDCLAAQLGRCDICIREYHRGRQEMHSQLLSDYDSDEVEEFMRKADALDKERIIRGLDNATETLLDLPPGDRKINAAGQEGMYAMFEALNCIPFLKDEDAMQKHFDRPFNMTQGGPTQKKMLLSFFAPGVTAFLFSSNDSKRAFAERNYDSKKIKRSLFPKEFEFGVKTFLEPAMARVNVISLELGFLPTFWRAVRRIVSKLDKSLIQNHLRPMDTNLYTLGLEHFQISAPHFPDLIATYTALLEIDSVSFWDAMGTITPRSVIDTISKAPSLEHALTHKQESSHGQQTLLQEQMSWLHVFIHSIKAPNLVTPLRLILDRCLNEYQGESYTHYASIVAMEVGLQCLIVACERIMDEVDGGPVYVHLVEGVAKDHIETILKDLHGIEKLQELQISKAQHFGLRAIQLLLAVDVKGFSRDRRTIAKKAEVDHQLGISNLLLWKLSMGKIVPGNSHLPMAVLAGITNLLALEPLPPKQVTQCQKAATAWNDALERICNHVSNILLDRLDSFSPDQLDGVYQEPSAAKGLMSLLFNGNKKVHNGALSVFKTLSSEDTRRECLMHVVKAFFGTTLIATNHCLTLISEAKAYEPCSNMLKLLRDIYSCLCDSQDGVLRSTALKSKADASALRSFWIKTWKALETIFETTEAWSGHGRDKNELHEFCRETMDFADFVFDQYSVIAGTLEAFEPGQDSSAVGRSLLQTTNDVFSSTTKWLRLRDEYLISKALDLTTKELGRLQEVNITVSKESSQYLKEILRKGPGGVKTKLTPNNKAELQRALENHLGESLSAGEEKDSSASKKQTSLGDWATSGSGQESRSGSSTPVPGAKPRKDGIDFDKWSSKAADRKKAQDTRAPIQKPPSLQQQKNVVLQKQSSDNFLLKRKQAQAEQERQKKAAIAKANLGAGSGVSGIGNFGKDHAAPGQTIMVDDDELDAEEDDDDDDDLDDDLFGSTNKPKKTQRPQLDVSGTVGLKPEVKLGPTRIARTARSAKDMRARLKPDLTSLHRHILGWDFFHDGDFPPGANSDEFSAVLNSFRDPSSYQNTFEPLLILEAWQGLVKERGENSSKPYEIQVKNRSNVDNFIEISSLLGQQENRDLSLMEGDIILLSTAAKPAKDPEAPHSLARVYRVKRQPKSHLEVVYQVLPASNLANKLTPQTIIHGLKVQSITPLEREYGALKSLQYYDLCNQIVRAKPSPRITFSEKQVSELQDVYNLNKAQSEAVNAALENDGFSLIQGPPGTGKTKTIVAIVGGILSKSLGSLANDARKITPNGAKQNLNDAPSKKLMVCAPSNAAIDEIVLRLKSGVKTKSGATHKINVVRIGRGEAINSQVVDVTMEELVQKKMGGGSADAKDRERDAEVYKEHSQISQQLRESYQRRDEHDSGNIKMDPAERKKLDESIAQLRRRKQELGNRIDGIKDQQQRQGREQDLNKKRAQQAVIDEAHVICATLSGSGHDMFSTLSVEFETVIIDEAAQCVEASSLIPLKYGCIKCIMVGDPKQLPPTVFSKEAARFQYEQSLFVRMQNNFPDDVHLLDTQYRMHPEISLFPSRSFYDDMLMDGKGMAALRKQPWHASSLLAPYRFFDVKGQHKSAASGNSLVNLAEIDVAMALFDRLMHDFRKEYDFNDTGGNGKAIGIITTYKAQLREMKSRFVNKYGPDINDIVEFNTTDAFQGRECEVIIFSCVRASPVGGIGFLQDIRRMNVGLTRAKSSLWVLGNSESLKKGEYWRKLIEHSRASESYTDGDLHGMLRQPSSAFPASETKAASMLDINSHQADMAKEAARRRERPDLDMSDAPSRNEPIDQSSDKMEGVVTKFSDRKKSVKDVEMSDADSDARDIKEELSNKKRHASAAFDGASDMPQQTKVKNEERRSTTPASAASVSNAGVASRSAAGSRAGTPQQDINGNRPRPAVIASKPKASAFMPKKKPRPPPR